MLEVSCRLAIQFFYMFHAQLFQQLRKNDTSNRVYTVNSHMEICLADCFYVYQIQCQHAVNVLLVIRIIFCILAQMIYISKLKSFSFCDTENFISFFLIQEFPMFIQQFQCIPLLWIMACSQDNTTTSTFHSNSQFCGRSRSQTDVYHIKSHPHQCSTYHIFHHFARDTGITSDNDFVTLYRGCLTNQRSVSRSKLYNIQRIQPFAGMASDSSTNTGNRFN